MPQYRRFHWLSFYQQISIWRVARLMQYQQRYNEMEQDSYIAFEELENAQEELNQLMFEKQKNETSAKAAFDQRIKETKQNAIEENIKNAEKSGNTLTQTIDTEGNLIGINNSTNTQEFSLKEQENISTADICAELFEGDSIIMGKSDNGQSKLVSGPFATKKKGKSH